MWVKEKRWTHWTCDMTYENIKERYSEQFNIDAICTKACICTKAVNLNLHLKIFRMIWHLLKSFRFTIHIVFEKNKYRIYSKVLYSMHTNS